MTYISRVWSKISINTSQGYAPMSDVVVVCHWSVVSEWERNTRRSSLSWWRRELLPRCIGRKESIRSDRDVCRLVVGNNKDLFQAQQWIRRRLPVDRLWRAHSRTNNKPARWRASQDEQRRDAWLMCMCIENYWLFSQLTKKDEVTIRKNDLQNKYVKISQMNAIQRSKLHWYADRKMFTESIIKGLMWKIASLGFSSLRCQ